MAERMRPASAGMPALDQIDSPRLILRNGTVASVRRAGVADRASLRAFFHDMSPASRRSRFFTISEPPDELIDRFADDSDPSRALTLIVQRFRSDNLRPIAVASYIAIDSTVAEVAFGVDDNFHGQGLGSLLLE